MEDIQRFIDAGRNRNRMMLQGVDRELLREQCHTKVQEACTKIKEYYSVLNKAKHLRERFELEAKRHKQEIDSAAATPVKRGYKDFQSLLTQWERDYHVDRHIVEVVKGDFANACDAVDTVVPLVEVLKRKVVEVTRGVSDVEALEILLRKED